MRKLKTLVLTIGAIAIAAPVHAGTPTLAGAPSPQQAYKMENGVKVYQAMTMPRSNLHTMRDAHGKNIAVKTTIEKGVKVHRLMPTPAFSSSYSENSGYSAFENQIQTIKKRAKKGKKKAYKNGYNEGFRDGYESAIENNPFRRPIRLRQRIRTRPRVSRRVLDRRNLQ